MSGGWEGGQGAGRGTARTGKKSACLVLLVHTLCAKTRLEIATFCEAQPGPRAASPPPALLLSHMPLG